MIETLFITITTIVIIYALSRGLHFIHRKIDLLLRLTLLILSLTFYLLGMTRVGGTDFENYETYFSDPMLIPDEGFRLLAEYSGLDFSNTLILQSAITLVALFLLSQRLRVSFIVSFSIFLLHSAIVRDFAQSRLALAVAILFLGLSQTKKTRRYLMYIIGASIHLTIIYPIIMLQFINLIHTASNKKILFLILLLTVIGVYFNNNLISLLALLDPRVDIYLSWDRAGYGLPVSDYSGLALACTLGIYMLWLHSKYPHELYKKLAIASLISVSTTVVFWDTAILAHRMSHLCLIMYPFVLAQIIGLRGSVRHTSAFQPRKIDFLSILVTTSFTVIISYHVYNKGIIQSIQL